MRIELSVTGLVAIALTCTGVGWSASTATPGAVYRNAAGSICETEEAQLNQHIPSGQNLAHDIEFIEKTQESTYKALARLEAPRALVGFTTELLTDLRALLRGYPVLVSASKKGMATYERAFAQQAVRDNRLGRAIGALWKKLGVASCKG